MQRQKGLDGLLRLARIILEARFAEQHAHMQVGHDQAVKRVIGGIRVFETQQPCPFALVDQRHGAAIDLPAAVFEQELAQLRAVAMRLADGKPVERQRHVASQNLEKITGKEFQMFAQQIRRQPLAGALIVLFCIEQIVNGWQQGFEGPEDADDFAGVVK